MHLSRRKPTHEMYNNRKSEGALRTLFDNYLSNDEILFRKYLIRLPPQMFYDLWRCIKYDVKMNPKKSTYRAYFTYATNVFDFEKIFQILPPSSYSSRSDRPVPDRAMNILDKQIVRITPDDKDLLPNQQINCKINDCSAVFSNSGNLLMHLTQHHGIKDAFSQKDDSLIKIYHCPVLECGYHEKSIKMKSFPCLKYLKQHYQKVHAAKVFKCGKCEKGFAAKGMLESHLNDCGKKYYCPVCAWMYNSYEALLTHMKRKGHKVDKSTIKRNADKIPIPRVSQQPQPEEEEVTTSVPPLPAPHQLFIIKFIVPGKDQQTQTLTDKIDFLDTTPPLKMAKLCPEPLYQPTETTQTDLSDLTYPDDSCFDQLVSNAASSLCDIETQTEFDSTSAILDQMLYSNMHTQTCDDFLTELGLADIQTQTNSSAFSAGAHDELLVSTETQTSFTQCLLDSTNEVLTQHTQTCDTLLEGLWGSQDGDFIGSFQSTHTQT